MNTTLTTFLSFFFITCMSVNAQDVNPQKEFSYFRFHTWHDIGWSSRNENWVRGKLFYGPHAMNPTFRIYDWVNVEGVAKEAQIEERQLTFKIYPWEKKGRSSRNSEQQENALFYKEGVIFKPVKLSRSQVSPRYQTKLKNSILTLYTKDIDASGKAIHRPAVEGDIPASASDVFSILFPTPKPFLYCVDISKSEFPMGSFLFVNREERDVFVTINGTQKMVKALEKELFPYELDETLLLRIDVKNSNKKGALSLVGQSVGGKKGQRIIGVFYKFRKNRSRLFLQREIDNQSIVIPSS